MNTRQDFYSEDHYKHFLKELDKTIKFCRTNIFESDSPKEESSLRAEQLQNLLFDRIFASYTVGVEIKTLIPPLEELIEQYETW